MARPSKPLTKQEQLRQYVIDRLKSGQLKPGDEMPTERALAEQVGVARGTVTRSLAALEQQGLIRRIQGRGTFVHEKAVARIRNISGVFALLVPQTRIPFYQSVLTGFEQAAWEANAQVAFVSTNDDPLRQGDAVLQLLDRGVAGLAVVPSTSGDAQAYQFGAVRRANVPLVFCNRPVTGVEAATLRVDAAEIGRRAARMLAQAGHERVAFHSSPRYVFYETVETAFREKLNEIAHEQNRGAPFIYTRYGDSIAEHDHAGNDVRRAWLLECLSGDSPPTALFSTFDTVSEYFFYLMTREGLRIPEDLSLLSLGAVDRGPGLSSMLSAVTVDAERLGRRAFELLSQASLDPDFDLAAVHESVPIGEWVGATLAAPGAEPSSVSQSPAATPADADRRTGSTNPGL